MRFISMEVGIKIIHTLRLISWKIHIKEMERAVALLTLPWHNFLSL